VATLELQHSVFNCGQLEEARHAVDAAISAEEDEAPYYVLKAQIVRDMGKEFAMKEYLDMQASALSRSLHWMTGNLAGTSPLLIC